MLYCKLTHILCLAIARAPGRAAGAITAALFLNKFVQKDFGLCLCTSSARNIITIAVIMIL